MIVFRFKIGTDRDEEVAEEVRGVLRKEFKYLSQTLFVGALDAGAKTLICDAVDLGVPGHLG